ncbi:MAG: B12-binding domain-containing radical SAM protein [Planctomycetota bacterium]
MVQSARREDAVHALLIQFSDPRATDPPPVFSHPLGVLAALADQRGISCSLVTLGASRRERVAAAVADRQPGAVVVDVGLHHVAAARRTTAALAELTDAPVAVVGAYATARPTRAISFPGVAVLALGEYERPIVAWLERLGDGRDTEDIEGLWTCSGGGLVRSGPAPLTADLDGLPFPDRELFDTARIIAETGQLAFKAARGCPLWCACCINDWYMDLYAGQDVPFVRRRSVANVLDEVESATRAYPDASRVSFFDHCFAMDAEWLDEFAAEYPRRCGLPLGCQARLEKATDDVAAALAAAGTRRVHTHIGSGSRFIREEVLSMHLSDEAVVAGCRRLAEAGLGVVVEVFVGAPYESEITVEETLDLLRRAGVDEVHPRAFYPAPGTRAAELCRENGWLTGPRESAAYANRSVLNMPSMPPEQINAVIDKFPSLLKRRRRTALRKVLDRATRSRRGA